MNTIEILDPTNESKPPTRQPAPRLTGLAGKRVALLDISKPLGNHFLDVLEEELRRRGAETERFSKPTFTKPAPVDLRHEIATRCDAVIEALAD
jgi:hypothetical protein